ncbi:MAG: cytidylate kinase-like family protein, partial [Desulfobacterales bacterium]
PEQIPPTICFSRKIGVGTLEIADLLSKKIGYPVIDRQLLDHVARNKRLSQKTVAFFDERYAGKISEFARLLFGEKAFVMSDYMRSVISTVFTFADMGGTIFVGRGIHLILPRDRVLAVRIICSDEYRINRLAEILDLEKKEIQKLLSQIDQEQRSFFKKAYGKKDASPYEFDIVINANFITRPQMAADIVAEAFNQKFATELSRMPAEEMNAA